MSLFTMPSLGADMEAGKLIEWLVKPGDHVAKGDIVAVVETQKGAIEIEIFEAGQISALLAEPGQTLPVGAPLAQIGTAEDAAPAVAPPPRGQPPQAAKPPAPPVAPAGGSGGPRPASPAARARAAELGLALETVAGSGPGGAVLLADVGAGAQGHPAPPMAPAGDGGPKGRPGLDLTGMRHAIAAAMSRSKRKIPHYYLSHEIALQAAQGWLAATNAARPPDRRLLMGALLVRATVRALARVPEMNGRFDEGGFVPSATVNCGLAIALRGGGLIAPAIPDAQDLDSDAIMHRMRDLVARTRAGRLRNSEITQGTITVSSLGETGVDALFGVIYPPQVALVGFGAPRVRPLILDGTLTPGLAVTATLAADHRVSDGRRGAMFL
ncbi:MAG: 2-oxo acid dehydrogenase subunit E2, partial [Rhodobacter sp.]|nr:2-oxo acid dehydrogenase subunit E2 [Rhodobacter sp.]